MCIRDSTFTSLSQILHQLKFLEKNLTGRSCFSSAKICKYTNSTYIFLRTILCYVLLRGSKSKLQNNSTYKKLLLFHTRFTFTMIRIYVIHVIITYRSLSPETTYFVISLQVWLAAVNRFVPESYKRKPTVSLSAFHQNILPSDF